MYAIYQSEIKIRPDDIDLNNHVHNTKYLDYILAARYEQMRDDYKMPMNDFHKLGYNWVISVTNIEYKRALKLEDKIIVKTQVDSINGAQVKVNFWIVFNETEKIAAQGYITYTMISIKNGRPVRITDEIIAHYTSNTI
ncbi:MAG: acyl-CoA thioesterase [Ignavibacteria bacterium]|jgi:acyl-CoA thioester hydrolase/thioesterase-3|nr:acyl-CoA thioesterase [Ignavibacteria bacterium]MDP3830462.1 acyl-CoA thioesterase [Ignavibacteriaceae bacterium]